MNLLTKRIFGFFSGALALLLCSGVAYADASYQATVKEGAVLLAVNDAKAKSLKQGDTIKLVADDLVCMRSGTGVVVISDSSNDFNKQLSTLSECLAIPVLGNKKGWFSSAKKPVGKYDKEGFVSTSLITLADGEYLVVENTSWYRNARTLPFTLHIMGDDNTLIKKVISSNNPDASLFVIPRKEVEGNDGKTYALSITNKSGNQILKPMQFSLEKTVVPLLTDTSTKIAGNNKVLQYQLFLQQQQLKSKIEKLGVEHPETANVYSKIGLLYLQLGKNTDAIVNLSKALNIRKKVLGKEDLELAQSYHDLGTAYEKIDVTAKEEYEKKATKIWESNYTRSRGTRVEVAEKEKREYDPADNTIVDVFYGTDRAKNKNRKKDDSLESFYLGKRDQLSYGIVKVSIPKTHKFGEMERPGRFFFTKENVKKHIMLDGLELMDDAKEFFERFNIKLNNIEENDIIVFIHGYNVSFGDAVRRTAQLSYDLKFKGLPMTYSWPSQSQTEEYWTDEASVQYTVPHLVTFLKEVIDNNERGAKANIHIIGHSMGTRALSYAAKELSLTYGGKQLFKNIIFAAPDIDQDVFAVSVFPYVRKTAEKITLYASSEDKALIVSASMHGGKRVGQGGDDIFVFEGLDTIDASGVDTDFLSISHSYFSEKKLMVNDIKDLIYKSLPPSKRKTLVEKSKKKLAYWGLKFD